ncbi:MAG: hypothetical protein P1R58_08440, partial [bacterium]|nr:hypothetical protein [bacterium]
MSNSKDKSENNAATQANDETQMPLADLMRVRYEKAEALRKEGINPYPYRFENISQITSLLDEFDKLSEAETKVR